MSVTNLRASLSSGDVGGVRLRLLLSDAADTDAGFHLRMQNRRLSHGSFAESFGLPQRQVICRDPYVWIENQPSPE